MKQRDVIVVTAGALAAAVVTAVVGVALGPLPALIVLAAISAGGWLVQVSTYRRLEARLMLHDQDYWQLAELMSLHDLLPLRAPLPRLRGWAISPDFANLLVATVLRKRPKVVVELGSGISTLVTGYLLERQQDGRLYSLDHDAAFLEVTRGNARLHGVEAMVELIHAPLVDTDVPGGGRSRWYDTRALPDDLRIDVLVIDGPPNPMQPMSRFPAVPMLYDRLAPDAVVLVDDAQVADIGRAVEQWARQYPDLQVMHVDTEKGAAVLQRHAARS